MPTGLSVGMDMGHWVDLVMPRNCAATRDTSPAQRRPGCRGELVCAVRDVRVCFQLMMGDFLGAYQSSNIRHKLKIHTHFKPVYRTIHQICLLTGSEGIRTGGWSRNFQMKWKKCQIRVETDCHLCFQLCRPRDEYSTDAGLLTSLGVTNIMLRPLSWLVEAGIFDQADGANISYRLEKPSQPGDFVIASPGAPLKSPFSTYYPHLRPLPLLRSTRVPITHSVRF